MTEQVVYLRHEILFADGEQVFLEVEDILDLLSFEHTHILSIRVLLSKLLIFVITASFAVVYVLIYHVFYALPLQGQEYETELAEATLKYANIDQVYDGPITDKAKLTPVAEVFGKNCATCHGKQAEGVVGPNLTDKYWLHGGDVNKIYNTIKYGKTEKNMPAWKSKFNNDQVYELASYILSLQGSNPANPKEAQGELEK